MNGSKAKGIITGCIAITFILGIANKLIKDNKLPDFRFFIGTGVLYLFLEFLAEFEAEIAQSIAIAIVTLTVLGEGGGVLDGFLGKGATATTLDTRPRGDTNNPPQHHPATAVDLHRRDRAITTTVAANGYMPVKPVLHTS